MNRRTRVSLFGALAVVLAACGGGSDPKPVDPIEITTTAIETGPPLDMDRTVDPNTGAFDPDEWPSACELIDEATVRSIFPQADGVGRYAAPAQLNLFGFVPGSESPTKPLTIPEATCTTTVGFPQDGLGLDDGSVVVQVTSAVAVAGSEEFVELNSKAAMSGDVSDVGGGACTLTPPGTYNCNTGRLIFSIHIDMRQTAQYTKADGSEYIVDGEELRFQGADPHWDSIIRDKVLVPIVEAAVARTTGSAS